MDSPSSAYSAEAEGRKRRRLRRGDETRRDDDSDSDEAEPEDELPEGEDPMAENPDLEEEEDGEDLLDNMEADYRPMETLDRYDTEVLDERDYSPLAEEQRLAAERDLDTRDRRHVDPLGRLAGAMDEDEEFERDMGYRERKRYGSDEERDDEEDEEEVMVNLETFDVPLREWITTDRPRREIKRRFRQFLLTYQDKSGRNVHEDAITRMAQKNEQSLEVNYIHLSQAAPILAIWLADAPKDMLEIFDEVAMEVVLKLFPAYRDIHDEIYVRVTDLPIRDSLRDLRQMHLNALIKVSGVVTRRTSVFPQLKLVKFTCGGCGSIIGPYRQTQTEIKISSCPDCEGRGPFMLNSEHTLYRNYQKITLQESPGSVPPGRVPRHKDVILVADLIDKARPGEEVEVTGVYTNSFDAALNIRQGFPVFSTVIEANFVRKMTDDSSSYHLTEEDKRKIVNMAKDPQVGKLIVESLAPSIYGHQHIKEAVALAMFGGERKDVKQKHRVRGDINVLLLGDPGTAKSQVLKYVEKTAPRSVYTTGKGASAVGLTAAVHKDPVTREWTLEGGALVLADRGVCLIDEFDKMNDGDRTSIHEAMEQQSISISKAGIVTTLQARCSVIAAANPIGGRYDPSKTFAENVELTDPIIQRFDILCVLQDEIDPVLDERLARFVVGSHARSHPDEVKRMGADDPDGPLSERILNDKKKETIPQSLLRKYIIYARTQVRPSLQYINRDKVASLYTELRKESMISGAIPIGVRHIESILRMSEAHARMHLRDYVRDDDVNMAIRVMVKSFVDAQKFSVKRQMERRFLKYINYNKDNNELLMHLLKKLVKEARSYAQAFRRQATQTVKIRCEDLEAKAHDLEILDLSDFYRSETFKRHFQLDQTTRTIVSPY